MATKQRMEPPRLRSIDNQLIAEVCDRLVAAANPHAIILFGSAARNQTHYGSDLDLIVVLDLPPGVTRRQKMRELHQLFEGWMVPLDILVFSPDEWKQGSRMVGHIGRVAAREGVWLYGRPEQR